MSEWYDHLNPIDQDEYFCKVCDQPMSKDIGYCCNNCLEADLM